MAKVSRYHIAIVLLAFLLVGVLRGNDRRQYYGLTMKPEIVPYRLKPSFSMEECGALAIDIIHPHRWDELPEGYKYEIEEILRDRIVFEETNNKAINEVFLIDDKPYILLRLPLNNEVWGEDWADNQQVKF